jgi:hypothetical protein
MAVSKPQFACGRRNYASLHENLTTAQLHLAKPSVLEASEGLMISAFSKKGFASAFFPAMSMDQASMWLPS